MLGSSHSITASQHIRASSHSVHLWDARLASAARSTRLGDCLFPADTSVFTFCPSFGRSLCVSRVQHATLLLFFFPTFLECHILVPSLFRALLRLLQCRFEAHLLSKLRASSCELVGTCLDDICLNRRLVVLASSVPRSLIASSANDVSSFVRAKNQFCLGVLGGRQSGSVPGLHFSLAGSFGGIHSIAALSAAFTRLLPVIESLAISQSHRPPRQTLQTPSLVPLLHHAAETTKITYACM